jgi:RNAse (barnase) inhibitor barstar
LLRFVDSKGHPILQDRFSILINEGQKNTTDVVAVPLGYTVDIEHEIPILGAILELTLGAYHCVYKDEAVAPHFVTTRSQGISVIDLLPPNVRNDVYISLDLENFISAAAQKKILLPSAFRIVATLVGKEGEQLLESRPLVGNYPENFNYHESKISLPKNALDDYQAHIVFQILGSDKNENVVPQVNKFVKPSHNRSDAATILKTPPVYDTPAAYGILMIYTNPGQLRSDRNYEILLYEGRAPTKKSPAEKGIQMLKKSLFSQGTIKSDLTQSCRDGLQDTEGNGALAIPSYLSSKRGDASGAIPVGLPLFFRVVSGSLLEDDILQNFLDSESKPKDQLKEIQKEQGNLFQSTNIFDIFKFHGHILAKISKLYRYQQSNNIMSELDSLWDLLTSVIATMGYSDANLSLLHSKFQYALRESFEGTELLKEYLDYIVDKKLKVYVKQATQGEYPDKIFVTLNFCFCYLLSGIFQHSMDLFDMNYLASLITSLFEINNGVLRAFPTQETKAMVMRHMKLLYPFLLSVIATQDLVDYFRKLLTIKTNDSHAPSYVTSALAFLTHLYQYDQASKWKRSELYLQVSLLPTTAHLLSVFLCQIRSNKGDSVWTREAVQTSLMEVASCIFMLLLPLLWQNAQQRVASTSIKAITNEAFVLLWAPAVLLLDVRARSTESTTIRDSVHCMCVSAYFSLLAANQGTSPFLSILNFFRTTFTRSNASFPIY